MDAWGWVDVCAHVGVGYVGVGVVCVIWVWSIPKRKTLKDEPRRIHKPWWTEETRTGWVPGARMHARVSTRSCVALGRVVS